jgi:hypothetical protein
MRWLLRFLTDSRPPGITRYQWGRFLFAVVAVAILAIAWGMVRLVQWLAG